MKGFGHYVGHILRMATGPVVAVAIFFASQHLPPGMWGSAGGLILFLGMLLPIWFDYLLPFFWNTRLFNWASRTFPSGPTASEMLRGDSGRSVPMQFRRLEVVALTLAASSSSEGGRLEGARDATSRRASCKPSTGTPRGGPISVMGTSGSHDVVVSTLRRTHAVSLGVT